jgi:hypothetical protein
MTDKHLAPAFTVLTREQIEAIRQGPAAQHATPHLDALCDMALRALHQPAVSREAVIEQCAKVCDAHEERFDKQVAKYDAASNYILAAFALSNRSMCEELADAIRALAHPAPSEEK